jgi:photosystem II stability/assembly factor-like uncharacterized protein
MGRFVRRETRIFRFLLLWGLGLLILASCFWDSPSGDDGIPARSRIHGVVTDKAGHKLQGVLVRLPAGAFSVTDAEGSFDLRDLEAGNYSLRLLHPDYVDTLVEAKDVQTSATLELDVRLTRRFATLRGKVLGLDGKPMLRARVTVENQEGISETPATGAFALENVEPGSIDVFFVKTGVGWGDTLLRVDPDREYPDLELHLKGSGGTVAFKAVDADGKPVRDAQILLLGDTVGRTDSAGEGTVSNLPPGKSSHIIIRTEKGDFSFSSAQALEGILVDIGSVPVTPGRAYGEVSLFPTHLMLQPGQDTAFLRVTSTISQGNGILYYYWDLSGDSSFTDSTRAGSFTVPVAALTHRVQGRGDSAAAGLAVVRVYAVTADLRRSDTVSLLIIFPHNQAPVVINASRLTDTVYVPFGRIWSERLAVLDPEGSRVTVRFDPEDKRLVFRNDMITVNADSLPSPNLSTTLIATDSLGAQGRLDLRFRFYAPFDPLGLGLKTLVARSPFDLGPALANKGLRSFSIDSSAPKGIHLTGSRLTADSAGPLKVPFVFIDAHGWTSRATLPLEVLPAASAAGFEQWAGEKDIPLDSVSYASIPGGLELRRGNIKDTLAVYLEGNSLVLARKLSEADTARYYYSSVGHGGSLEDSLWRLDSTVLSSGDTRTTRPISSDAPVYLVLNPVSKKAISEVQLPAGGKATGLDSLLGTSPFQLESVEIIVSSDSGGHVIPSGNIQVLIGARITFSLRPDSGYFLEKFYVDGDSVAITGPNTYEIKSVKRSQTLRAQFAHVHSFVKTVEVKPDTLRLYAGGASADLTALVSPGSADAQVEWRSLNPAVASVGPTGRVLPASAGSTEVRAISREDSTRYGKATVLVVKDTPRLSIGPVDTVIGAGKTLSFAPAVVQDYGRVVLFMWDPDGDGTWNGTSDSLASISYRYDHAASYTARFYVKDTEGNDTTVTLGIRVVPAPVVSIFSPADSAFTNRTTIDVGWTVNGVAQSPLGKEVLTHEGANTVTRTAVDEAGNLFTYSITVFLDTVPPKPPLVKGRTPVNIARGDWTWTSGGGGNGVFRCRVDDPDMASAPQITDTFFTKYPPNFEGVYTLCVQERDDAGNWSASGCSGVRIDYTPPGPPNVSVSPSSPTSNRRPTWSWLKEDSLGGAYLYRLDNPDMTGLTETSDLSFSPQADLSEGLHTLYVQQRDSAGNFSFRAAVPVRIDVTPPSAPKVSSPGGFHSTQPRPAWIWSAGGGGGMGTYRYKLDDSVLETGATTTQVAAFTPGADLPVGSSHVLYVQEMDSAGNWSRAGSAAIRIHGQAGYVWGGDRALFRTSDGGASWDWKSGGGLNRVRFLDASTGYIVGSNGLIIKTVDGGATWITLRTGTTHSFSSLYFVDKNVGYVSSFDGFVLKTMDGGASWASKSMGMAVHALFFPVADTGYAINNSGTVFKTSDGGNTWVTLPAPPSENASLYFISPDTGFVTGRGTIKRTVDGGNTWVTKTVGSEYLYSICFAGSQTGYAVGFEPGQVGSKVYKTLDGGGSWTALNPGVDRFTSVQFTDENTGYLAGYRGAVLKTTDGGNSWTSLDPGTNADLSSIHFADASTGYAVGYPGTIRKTTNGGATWSVVSESLPTDINAFFFTDPGVGYAAGDFGRVFKTTDEGASWIATTTGTGEYVSSIWFTDKNVGYAAGSAGTLFKTLDAGKTWNQLSSGSSQFLQSIFFPDARTGYVAGDGGVILRTRDGGTSWTALSTGSNESMRSLYFLDSDTGYAASWQGTILKTSDGGETWATKVSGADGFNLLYTLYFTDGATAYAPGSSLFDGAVINKTLNGWSTWDSHPSGLPTKSVASGTVFFTDLNTGYWAGPGGILKTSDGGSHWSSQLMGADLYFSLIFFP